MASIYNERVHWFEPKHVPKEYLGGHVGVCLGAVVDDDTFEDVVLDIQYKGRCTRDILPLGQVVDEGGAPYYAFIVHPEDTEGFWRARCDSRYCGLLSWAKEESQLCEFPDEFLNFIF